MVGMIISAEGTVPLHCEHLFSCCSCQMWRGLRAGYISRNTPAVGGGKHTAYSEGFTGVMKDNKHAIKKKKKASQILIQPENLSLG